MSNTDTATSAAPAPAKKVKSRKKQAEHIYLNSVGEEVGSIESGTGYRYHVVDAKGEKIAGEYFDFQIPTVDVNGEQVQIPAGSVAMMLALFGAKTVATNAASRNRNSDSPNKGDFENDVAAVNARYAQIKIGDWGVAEGGGGFQLDPVRLLAALVEVQTAAGHTVNETKVSEAMAGGGTIGGVQLDAKGYMRAVYNVAGVKDAYSRLGGKEPTTADDVADDFQ